MKKSVPIQKVEGPAKKFLILGTASGWGLGFLPIAPGTWGSLLGIPLGLLLLQAPTWLSFLILCLLIVAACPICERASRHWGVMDSKHVVLDEIIGQAIAFLGLRYFLLLEGTQAWMGFNLLIPSWIDVVLAFLAFRLFDIFKPYPARAFDRKESGMGIVLDDVVAGIYAALLIWLLHKLHILT